MRQKEHLKKLFFYTHTHWDREWHQPFESFRAQLIPVVRNILSGLEAGQLPKFYLDGQSVIFEDIAEIDPSLAPRIKACMESGKLAAGPWYVLADQMLVSGESLVRNLKYGLDVTRQYGAPAMIGYSPDTFGHTADMPRILNGFGIKTAVVWRGVPLLEMGPLFWWGSPDGSRVLTYHLTHGYFQTGFHEADATERGGGNSGVELLTQSLLPWLDLVPTRNGAAKSYYKLMDGALLPIGGDHVGPPPKLNDLVSNVNERLQMRGHQAELVPTTLSEFLTAVSERAGKGMNVVQVIESELRSNRAAANYERGYLLYGVLSTRLYLKRANRLAEFRLARIAEPLLASLSAMNKMQYPAGQFDYAWKTLLKNSAHDSICGCSVDEVHREMMSRTAKINDVIDTMLIEASCAVAGKAENPALTNADPAFGSRSVSVFNFTGSAVTTPVAMKWFVELDDKRPWRDGNVQIASRKKVDQLFSGWGAVPYYKEVEMLDGWLWADNIPPLGSKTFEWPRQNQSTPEAPVVVHRSKVSNGLLDVAVSKNGRVTVSQARPGKVPRIFELGHKLKDVGDGGDSYNFDPLPDDKPIEARLVSVQPGKQGPLVGSLLLTYEIDIPQKAIDYGPLFKAKDPDAGKIRLMRRSAKRIKHKITTEITLKRANGIVFFETSWDNHSDDHKLSVFFNTEHQVQNTFSENHFSCLKRNHHQPAKPERLPVPTAHEQLPDQFPCQRFFVANGQMFLNAGLPEYGVAGNEVSITLLRAMSWLSKPRLWSRGGGAGPNVAVPEANCHGRNVCSYGWAPLSVPERKSAFTSLSDHSVTEAYKLAELYEGPLWATTVRTGSRFEHSLARVDNEAIRAVAFFFDPDLNEYMLRLLNVTMEPQRVKLFVDSAHFYGACVCSLNGDLQRPLEISTTGTPLDFGENELKSIALKALPKTT